MGNVSVNSFLFQPPAWSSFDEHISDHIIWLRTATKNRIPSLFFRRPGAKFTILFSHANAEDLSFLFEWLKTLSHRLNVNVFAYDYTGYGGSVGTPSEENCYADIEAAYEYLLEQRNIKPEKIIIYGKSVGSGPSVYLAAKVAKSGRNVGGLLLHSPFKSVYRVMLNIGFTMSGDKFPNIDRIGKVRCPTFIVHGEDDEVVPISHGQDLYEAIPDKYKVDPFWVKDRGHNDIEHEDMIFLTKIGKFLYHCFRVKMYPTKFSAVAKAHHMTGKNISSPCRPCSCFSIPLLCSPASVSLQ